MKRVLYNNYLKFIAFILCALSVAFASYLVTTNFFKEDNAYFFESSYEDSRFAADSVVNQFHKISNMLENTMDENGKLHPERIQAMPSPDEWECYIKTDGGTYSNLKNQEDGSYEKFSGSLLAAGVKTKDGETRHNFRNCRGGYRGLFFIADDDGNIPAYELCVRMGEKYIQEQKAEWEAMRLNAEDAAKNIIVLLIFGGIMFVYLICTTGKKYGSDEIQMMLVDKMFVEITAALLAGIFFGLGALTIFGAGYLIIEEEIVIANELSATAVFIVISLSLLLFLSLVRNLKNGTFIKRSLIVKIWRFLWKTAVVVFMWIWETAKKILKWVWKTVKQVLKGIKSVLSEAKRSILMVSDKHFDGRFVGIIIVAFSILIFLMTIAMLASPVLVLFLVAAVVGAVIFVNKRLVGFNNLKNGIEKIKNGDLNHKITDCPEGVIGSMAENINSIGDGLQKSLENEVRAERMKSELITNVSHDLKTPLTSIINYADLLSQEELTPPEANDYVKIIKQKGERLKQLTSDLFDISKAQSGNEEFNIEDIDLCLLVNQAMGELNTQIEKSGLVFKVSSSDKEIFVRADGKKMSRVFENLLNNCVKYSMANTRVYIDIEKSDNGAIVEIKNIAGYEMDFDESEITERFVRGDSARSTEGSGLGLAIVKSYVEGCGGSVRIRKDGDLFKVIIQF